MYDKSSLTTALDWESKDEQDVMQGGHELQQVHHLFGPYQSFFIDTAIYTIDPQAAIFQVNDG
eukprot:scaffold8828_cov204-Amphora_coffeaeformis.AAC.11